MMKRFLIFLSIAIFSASISNAATVFLALSPSENTAKQAEWESAAGEAADFTQDFESGFTDGQNMDGESLGGGATVESVNATVLIESGAGSIGGSNPIGSFALEAGEALDQYRINFATAVDYVSLFYIDLTGMTIQTSDSIGLTSYRVDGTGASGDTAEFFGFVAGNSDERISSLLFTSVGGSAGWGIDNLSWGVIEDDPVTPPPGASPIPLPAGLPLLLVGIGVFGLLRKRSC